jgi:hypothetical protein
MAWLQIYVFYVSHILPAWIATFFFEKRTILNVCVYHAWSRVYAASIGHQRDRTIVVKQDPIERFVSAFKSKCLNAGDGARHFCKKPREYAILSAAVSTAHAQAEPQRNFSVRRLLWDILCWIRQRLQQRLILRNLLREPGCEWCMASGHRLVAQLLGGNTSSKMGCHLMRQVNFSCALTVSSGVLETAPLRQPASFLAFPAARKWWIEKHRVSF